MSYFSLNTTYFLWNKMFSFCVLGRSQIQMVFPIMKNKNNTCFHWMELFTSIKHLSGLGNVVKASSNIVVTSTWVKFPLDSHNLPQATLKRLIFKKKKKR